MLDLYTSEGYIYLKKLADLDVFWRSREINREKLINSLLEESKKRGVSDWKSIRSIAIEMFPARAYTTIYGDSKVVESLIAFEKKLQSLGKSE